MRFWLDEGDVMLWVASAAIVVWIIQYSWIARWWHRAPGPRGTRYIGITIVGLAVVLLLVYIPSLLALAWPAQFANFAGTRWYTDLAIVIVNASALFLVTRIITWEYLRRQRRLLAQNHFGKVAELEAEIKRLRERLGEG